MAIEDLAANLLGLIELMPLFVQIFTIVALFLAVLFYGGLAVKGLRRSPGALKFPLIVGSGLLCIAAAPVIYSFLNIDLGPLEVFQPQLIIGGIIATIITNISFWMISSGLEDRRFEQLVGEVQELKKLLLEKKVIKPLSDNDAKRIAGDATKCKPTKATMGEGFWDVLLDNNGKDVKVMVDSVTGNVRDVQWHSSPIVNFLLADKLRIVGIVLIVAMIGVTVTMFKGLPTFQATLEGMGLTPELFSELSEAGNQYAVPEGCTSLYEVQKMIDAQDYEPYDDQTMKATFEQERGSTVSEMYLLERERNIIIAVMEDTSICYSQAGQFCRCAETR